MSAAASGELKQSLNGPWQFTTNAAAVSWDSITVPKPAPPSLNGSKYFTTACGSTAPSVSNHQWTLKRNSSARHANNYGRTGLGGKLICTGLKNPGGGQVGWRGAAGQPNFVSEIDCLDG